MSSSFLYQTKCDNHSTSGSNVTYAGYPQSIHSMHSNQSQHSHHSHESHESHQSQSSKIWLKNVGAILLTIHNQPLYLINIIQKNSQNLNIFYETELYQETKQKFLKYGIVFQDYDDIGGNKPSQHLLLTKIYCTVQPHSFNKKYIIQFPVLLIDADIRKLKNLNKYQSFPRDQIWIQYFYKFNQYNNQYQICDNIYFSNWNEIIDLCPFNIMIRNHASIHHGDGNVITNKVKTVAITELNKNNSYSFDIIQMTKYYAFNHNEKVSLIISMNINHHNKSLHFQTIIDEINRHIMNNINDRNMRYKAESVKNVKSMDFDTAMIENAWNIPNEWNMKITAYRGNDDLYITNSKGRRQHINNADIFSISFEKISKVKIRNKPYYDNNNYMNMNNNNINNEQYGLAQNNANNSNINKIKELEYDYSDESDDEYEEYTYCQYQEPQYKSVESVEKNNDNGINKEIECESLNEIDPNYSSSATPSPPPPHQKYSNHDINNNMNMNMNNNNNNNSNNDTMTVSIDDNLSCFQPGAPTERNKEFQRQRQREKPYSSNSSNLSNSTNSRNVLNEEENKKDLRGFVIESPQNAEKFAVIIDIDYDRNRSQYKIVDFDNNEKWQYLSSSKRVLAKDMISKSVDAETKMEIIKHLTPKQILHIIMMKRD